MGRRGLYFPGLFLSLYEVRNAQFNIVEHSHNEVSVKFDSSNPYWYQALDTDEMNKLYREFLEKKASLLDEIKSILDTMI